MDQHDTSPAGGRLQNPDRRAALAGLGIGATAAWVAPTILSAPAASAATVQPGCPTCEQELLVNGDAETGSLVPWTSVAAGNGATFAPTLWSSIADRFTAPPGAGQYAFFIESSTNTIEEATLQQRIAIPDCVGESLLMTGRMGAVTTGSSQQTSVRLAIQYLDSNDDPIVFAGISVTIATSLIAPASTADLSEVTVVPLGAVTAQITMGYSHSLGPAEQATVSGVFDLIGLSRVC